MAAHLSTVVGFQTPEQRYGAVQQQHEERGCNDQGYALASMWPACSSGERSLLSPGASSALPPKRRGQGRAIICDCKTLRSATLSRQWHGSPARHVHFKVAPLSCRSTMLLKGPAA